MEFLMRMETKSMLNWLSFCGYYISQLLWYFLFDVVYNYFRRTQEQQPGQDGVIKTKCVTSHHQGQDMMIVGTKSVTASINQPVYQPVYMETTTLYTVNSDDSDYDGDDESSEDYTDNEIEINSAKQKLEYHGSSPGDAREERFEMASEQWEVTTAKPSKPKKAKSKRKKSKPKTKKRSKPSQTKEKKPKGNGSMTNQCLMGNVTDDTVKWPAELGTQQRHHPIKRPSKKRRSVATADEGSCTTSCVQCCDTN